MAFTYDGSPTTSNATSSGLTVSHTTAGTADLLVCCLSVRGLQTVNSLTYAGAALSLAKDQLNSGADEKVYIYYKVGPATGANNLVVGLSGSVLHFVSVFTFTADNTPSLDVTGGNNGSGAGGGISASVTGGVGTLGVDAVVTENNAAPPFSAAGGDQTVIHNTGTGSFGIATSYELNPASNEQFDWTHSGAGSDWGMAVALFQETGGGGGVVVKPLSALGVGG